MDNRFCLRARVYTQAREDGEPLSLLEHASAQLHERVCPRCKRYYRSLEATREALNVLRDEPAPPPMRGPE